MENIKYIGNAKIIKSLADLPKIGGKFDGLTVFEAYKNAYCISINAYEYEDIQKEVRADMPEDKAEKYLFFKVYYTERKGKHIYLGVDTFHFLYCILKENIQ